MHPERGDEPAVASAATSKRKRHARRVHAADICQLLSDQRKEHHLQRVRQVIAAYGKVDEEPRIRERTILHVLKILKKWTLLSRELATISGERSLSPGIVSTFTGLNRRTLNYYLRLIRLGEMFGFDFLRHLQQGIGVLRNFVESLPKELTKQFDRNRHQNVHLVTPYILQ